MPEYLAPGVFIEEIPPQIKAIEGVSTSTAGFVGPAERGPVPGRALPFTPPAGFAATADPAPLLITSLSDFTRVFGGRLALDGHHYLSYAVRAFFDNGGKRCYVARVADTAAKVSALRLYQGTALRLAKPVTVAGNDIFLTSLRGVTSVPATTLTFRKADGTTHAGGPWTVVSYDNATGKVTLSAAAPFPLDPNSDYVTIGTLGSGPRFWARSPGAWGQRLSVSISHSERGRIPIVADGDALSPQIKVQSGGSFYRGAVIEIDRALDSPADPGHDYIRSYHEVTGISGSFLSLNPPLAARVKAGLDSARVVEVDVVVSDSSGVAALESFRGLSWNRTDLSRHYANVINARSRLVYVEPAAAEGGNITTQPTNTNGLSTKFSDGVIADGSQAGDDPTVDDGDYVGADLGPGKRSGLESLKVIDEVRIVAIPGQTSAQVQNALITQCELLRYRFAVLDAPPDVNEVGSVLAHRNAYDTSYAAYYAPWVEITDGGQKLLMPPAGYVAGVYARTDTTRGVWKAPANEDLRNVTGLAVNFTAGEQEVLNPRGVNAIRRFEGRGIRIWGARTLSSESDLRYVNVRRFLVFLEASIDQGTQFAVFEPNTPETWGRITNTITAFLTTQWRNGALFGSKPEEAFFVRCDNTTMTSDDILNGRLICQIGVAIVRPAEFVIFRIEQITTFGK